VLGIVARLKRIVRASVVGVGALLVLALLFVAARLALYRQADDAEHVATKRAFLERLRGLPPPAGGRPSFVVVLFDDLGHGDLGAYGGAAIRTPHLDRIASDGVMFRNGYAASPYCSASRAALLTGRYAVRSGMDHVLQPAGTDMAWLLRLGWRNHRLPAEEITIAEALAAAGYATAAVGKWHLGAASPSLPNDRGFDSFFGTLYSNDQGRPEILEDGRVVEPHPIDQTTLTRRYTERAVRFIETHADRPFFLYLAHNFPHVPLHVADDRRGRSDAGLYGDVVEELDASVGEVVAALERSGAAERTLLVVTSDNGPWFQGSPGGLRGRKMDVFEGGMRVPLLAAWPGRLPGGRVVDEIAAGIDLFPTVLDLAGLPLPDDRAIDGESLAGLLEGRDWVRREPLHYYSISKLLAVREGRFKYHAPHAVLYGNPMDWAWGPMRRSGPWLFDLDLDSEESYDVSARHPAAADRLRAVLAARERADRSNPHGWR
jgi:uncharacterized sulfatase